MKLSEQREKILHHGCVCHERMEDNNEDCYVCQMDKLVAKLEDAAAGTQLFAIALKAENKQLESSLAEARQQKSRRMIERDRLRSRIWNLIRIGHNHRDSMMSAQTSLTEAREEIEELQKIVNSAHEWSAGYPLGGGMDEIAAKNIYEKCMTLAEAETV